MSGSTDAGILVTWRESPLAAKALLVGILVNRLGAFIQIFLVLFLTFRHFSTVQAGVALGVYSVGSVAGALLGGELSDRLGPRRTILVSMAGTAGMVLAVLYLHSYPAMLAAVALVGAMTATYRPAAKSLLSELTPAHRQVMIFAMYRLAYNISTTAAPLIGAALVAVSYDLLFWAEAVACLAFAVIAGIALPRRGAAASRETPVEERSGSYLVVLRDGRYVLFLLALLTNAAVYTQYLSALPVAMRSAGLNTAWFSAMLALNGFIVITCELLVTKVVQTWPMRITVAVGFVLLGGGLACYTLPIGAAAFVLGTLVWSLAEVVAGPTMFAYSAVASPERHRGRYIGAASAVFGVGSAIGPVVGLALWERVHNGVWWWYAAATLGGIAAGWFGMRAPAAAPPETETAEAPGTPNAPLATDPPGAPETPGAPAPAQRDPHDQTDAALEERTQAP
ncbi:MFS transporter [Longispora sp. K20-0274]|uniref:MDR family MFS transporter n=1 Tax=Longispora sp. K20-0274 TaxID=3088255 RepID=UPI00399AE74E